MTCWIILVIDTWLVHGLLPLSPPVPVLCLCLGNVDTCGVLCGCLLCAVHRISAVHSYLYKISYIESFVLVLCLKAWMSERIAYRTQLTNQDQHITSSDYLRLLAVRKKKKRKRTKLGSPSSRSGSFLFSSTTLFCFHRHPYSHLSLPPSPSISLPYSLLYYPNFFFLSSILLVLYWFIIVLLSCCSLWLLLLYCFCRFNYLPTSIPTTLPYLLYYHAL